MLIKNTDFHKVADSIKPDAKRRVVLPGKKVLAGVTYHVYINDVGQIVLDPQITIPASEAWLFENPEALASVRRGLREAAKGKVTKIRMNTL